MQRSAAPTEFQNLSTHTAPEYLAIPNQRMGFEQPRGIEDTGMAATEHAGKGCCVSLIRVLIRDTG